MFLIKGVFLYNDLLKQHFSEDIPKRNTEIIDILKLMRD